MLKKKYRGLSPLQVSELFRSADGSVSDQFFRVNWKRVPQGFPQFVIITPAKSHRSAVGRNRLRRQISALLQLHFPCWTAGVRVAILVKTPVAELSVSNLQKAFLAIMARLPPF